MARIRSGRFRTKTEAKQFHQRLLARPEVSNPRIYKHSLGGFAVSYDYKRRT